MELACPPVFRYNHSMTAALVSGIVLGVSCGLAPGPLMALLLLQTLRHGPREGCKVALVPLLSDAPVILLAVVFAARASQANTLFGILSLVGAAFLLYLAVGSFRPVRLDLDTVEAPNSFIKGTLVNILSPHPWLFWLTVGASALAQAMKTGWPAVAAFLAIFYLGLVGSKIILALMAERSRRFLEGRAYHNVARLLGVVLAGCAVLMLRQGLLYLHVLNP
jgi:threonine/homoserine/homoserine lactone efflux protein